jgi:hypothetical protein
MLRTGLFGVLLGLIIAVLGSAPLFIPGINILDPTTDLIILGAVLLVGLLLGVAVMSLSLVLAGTGIGRNPFLTRHYGH